ncbi:MAG: DUF2058 family protein [Planctomycetes bacterium]|nr:DUF2058 family protein [Planctomycetota bacterium]
MVVTDMSLRDQLKKANLISDKDARRLAHEARVERTDKGVQQIEKEQQQRQQELVRLQTSDRDKTAKEQQQIEAQKKLRDEAAAVEAILANECRRPSPGPAKFYFQTDDGSLPYLEMSPRDAQQVQSGALCIVRNGPRGTHDYRLLTTELARRVFRLRPERIVFAPRG